MKEKKPNKRDNCVCCGNETQYDEFDHIDKSFFYVDGCGQLCVACWNKLYEHEKAK